MKLYGSDGGSVSLARKAVSGKSHDSIYRPQRTCGYLKLSGGYTMLLADIRAKAGHVAIQISASAMVLHKISKKIYESYAKLLNYRLV